MNGLTLYEAMGQIRPAYVEEAEKQCFPLPRRRRLLPVAACLMAAVGLALAARTGFDSLGAVPGAPAQTIPGAADAVSPAGGILHLLLQALVLLLAVTAVAAPLVTVVTGRRGRKLHLLSFGCLLAHLLVSLWLVGVEVRSGMWADLQQSILPRLVYGGALLVLVPVLNGLCRLKARRPALVFSLLMTALLLLPALPDHTLIDEDAVVSLAPGEVSLQLARIINQGGGVPTVSAPTYYDTERPVAAIETKDGSTYFLLFVYDSGFSFHPLHFGEDETHYLLIRTDPRGRATNVWRMTHRFEALYIRQEVTK